MSTVLSRIPEGCVRARCWCSWWVAKPKMINNRKFACRNCEIPLQIATQKDLDAVGATVREETENEKKRSGPGRKSKAERARETSGDNLGGTTRSHPSKSRMW